MSRVSFFIPGWALMDFGESMLRLAEVKDSLDIDVKQNFIDPLQTIADKDIKDIQVTQTGQGRKIRYRNAIRT